VTLGALAVTERELARVLNLAHYAHRPPARGLKPDAWRTAYARHPLSWPQTTVAVDS
jgi:hypothetical protein